MQELLFTSDATRERGRDWLLQSVLEVQALITEEAFDLGHFMQRVVDLAESLTHALGAVVEIAEGDEMVYRAASASIRDHLGLRLKRNGSLSGLCVAQAAALRCDDVDHDPRVDREACLKVGVRSMICAPLLRRGQAVGALKVMADRPRAFDATDQYLLTLMAGAIGSALANQLALDALRTSEETFRTAMETASIGMALVKQGGRFLNVNAALCRLLGYDEDELLALDLPTLAVPEDRELDSELIARALRGDIAGYRIEKRYRHRSGRIVWVLQSVSLAHDAAGAPSYFVSQLQDISEQRELERVKSEFISVVSHELRTPLTSIRGALGLVVGAMSQGLPEKVQDLLAIALDNAVRLLALTDDILDIDKLASGQMRFDVREHSLATLTTRAVAINQAYAQRFDVHIDLEPIETDASIRVDEDRYLQVLSNLLSNAAKFSPRGGRITVRASSSSGWARVCVTDRGPGIPAEFRDRIFQKFSQADSSATRRAGGTGLGLHITRQFVEKMHGRIGFDTAPGAGTTFWVEFPCLPRT